MKTIIKNFCLVVIGICFCNTAFSDGKINFNQTVEINQTSGAKYPSLACTTHEDIEGDKVIRAKDIVLLAYNIDKQYKGIKVQSGTFWSNNQEIDWKNNQTFEDIGDDRSIGRPSIATNANGDIILFYEKYDTGSGDTTLWYRIGKTMISDWSTSNINTIFDKNEYPLFNYKTGKIQKGSRPFVEITANVSGGGYVYLAWHDSDNKIHIRSGRLMHPMDKNGNKITAHFDSNEEFIPAPIEFNSNNMEPVLWSSTDVELKRNNLELQSSALSLKTYQKGNAGVALLMNSIERPDDFYYTTLEFTDSSFIKEWTAFHRFNKTNYHSMALTLGLVDKSFSPTEDRVVMIGSERDTGYAFYDTGEVHPGAADVFHMTNKYTLVDELNNWCYPYLSATVSPKINGNIVTARISGTTGNITYNIGTWNV